MAVEDSTGRKTYQDRHFAAVSEFSALVKVNDVHYTIMATYEAFLGMMNRTAQNLESS